MSVGELSGKSDEMLGGGGAVMVLPAVKCYGNKD